jgi:hypothetical protein
MNCPYLKVVFPDTIFAIFATKIESMFSSAKFHSESLLLFLFHALQNSKHFSLPRNGLVRNSVGKKPFVCLPRNYFFCRKLSRDRVTSTLNQNCTTNNIQAFFFITDYEKKQIIIQLNGCMKNTVLTCKGKMHMEHFFKRYSKVFYTGKKYSSNLMGLSLCRDSQDSVDAVSVNMQASPPPSF